MLFISFIFSFFLAQCLKRLRYNPLLNARTCFLICFTPSNWVQQIQALTHNTHTHTTHTHTQSHTHYIYFSHPNIGTYQIHKVLYYFYLTILIKRKLYFIIIGIYFIANHAMLSFNF